MPPRSPDLGGISYAFLLAGLDFFEACAQLATGGGDIIAALGSHAIADTVLEENGAERANGIWPRGTIAGRGGVDGNAVYMGKLLEGCQKFAQACSTLWSR